MLSRKLFVIPYALFLLSFVVTPLVLIVIYSFTTPDWRFTFQNYGTIFNANNINTLLVSLFIAIITTGVCLLIGYPLAYLLADKMVNKQMDEKQNQLIVDEFLNSDGTINDRN